VIVKVEVDIARPRHQVFDLMADARNELAWNSKVSRSELISDEPIGKGTEFRTTNRGQKYVAFITTYDRPDQVGFNVAGKAMEINASMRFADSADGTRMAAQFDLQPKGFMKLMMPLMAGAVRKDFPKQLTSFKEFCESSVDA
jgi:hypothetical protein